MPLFRRYEGDPVPDAPLEQRILSFLDPRRGDAQVFYDQDIDARPLLAWLDHANRDRPKDDHFTVFHVVTGGIVRALQIRPKMNRFVVGGVLYQRKWVDISFIVKKQMHDDGKTSAVKVHFEDGDTLEKMVGRIKGAVGRGRKHSKTASEREMALGLKLPRVMLKGVVAAVRTLDFFNLLPASMIDADELYSSAFLANLGGVGLAAPQHHLYDWGTIPMFTVIGKIEKKAVVNDAGKVEVRDILPLRWTFDERCADGYYAAGSLDMVRDFVVNPEALMKVGPPAEKPWTPEGTPKGRRSANTVEVVAD
ncbi:MAG: 2-oxo acid dehydrogenase subunit E2 [Myxococcales bacterium]